jgi:RecA/RadA recombinase
MTATYLFTHMAKSTPTKTAPKEPADKADIITPESILAAELKANKADHYNFEEEVTYKVSTGSLSMDIETGGVGPGLFSVGGIFESGKSSFTLACMKNFLETIPNARGVYIKAEGRLSTEMRQRSGIDFVFGEWKTVMKNDKKEEIFDTSAWVNGTCFVLETNIYEMCLNTMRQLVSNNDGKHRYFFFIDSMDGMTLRDDQAKEINEANKVAGAPALTKKFLQKMANAMAKRGHICAISAQVSSNIQLDPYAGAGMAARPLSGGGGFAKVHFSNFIFEFQPKYQGDYILEDPAAKPDRLKNKILGHWVKIKIVKSPNEKSNIIVSYPVKYGRTNGQSVWVEYEIVDSLLMFNLLTKSGSWLSLADSLLAELKEKGHDDVPSKLQGVDNWRKLLEERQDLTKYLFKRFSSMVTGA